jgi:DNA-directed RNA polymerase specialized sigma24 family protein
MPREDPHAIDTVSEDAVLMYLRDPARYNPVKSRLLTWLTNVAIRRLIDFERSRRRRSARESPTVDVTSLPVAAPAEVAEPDDAWMTAHRAAILAAARSDAERAFILARLEGAPRDVQAVALGVGHLGTEEARREMNRVWQLLGRRARRGWLRAPGAGIG